MNPNTPSNVPALQQGYVPYFYQIGLQYIYRTPQDWQRKRRPATYATPHDFSSGRAVSRNLDHPQTVEQIIERGYFSIPRGDPITAIITDKVHTSWIGLDDVLEIFAAAPSIEINKDDISGDGMTLVDLVVSAGLAKSKGEARRTIEGGGMNLQNIRENDVKRTVSINEAIEGKALVLRKGQKDYRLVLVK